MHLVAAAYAATFAALATANKPVAGWHNLVSVTTLAADEEDADFPATNLANPATNLLWKSGSTADQFLTVLFGATVEVDYVAFQRHNLGSGVVQFSIEALPPGGNPAVDLDWDEVYAADTADDDKTLILRFAPTSAIGVRVLLEPATVEPQAAVMFAGKLMIFEKGVQASPILSYARERNVIGVWSEAGDFLGSVINGGKLASSVSFRALTAAWARSTLDPFLDATAGVPFFWAWRPLAYPAEVAYAAIVGDPKWGPADNSGFVDVTLPLEGLLT